MLVKWDPRSSSLCQFFLCRFIWRSTVPGHHPACIDPCHAQFNLGNILMASCKTAVTPLLTHWSYCSLALSHRYKHISIFYHFSTLKSHKHLFLEDNNDLLIQHTCTQYHGWWYPHDLAIQWDHQQPWYWPTVKSQYKAHQIPKFECFLSNLATVFVQFIEARC